MSSKQFLIAVDQLVNTLLGGMADETVSARAYRNRDTWKLRMRFINWLFNDPKHCEDSYLSEMNKLQLPEEYRCDHVYATKRDTICDNSTTYGAIIGVVLLVIALGYLIII